MPTVRIRRIQHQRKAAEQLAALPKEVLDALYEQLKELVGRELEVGGHVEILSVEGHVVSVDFFVDTDGTLWIEEIESG